MANANGFTEQMMMFPVGGRGFFGRKGGKGRKSLAASLILTSLVDVFSMLVIYLLFNSGSGETLELSKAMQLPAANHMEDYQSAPSIKFESGRYLVNDVEVPIEKLAEKLNEVRLAQQPATGAAADKPALLIQADRNTDMKEFNPIIIAGSQAGFRQFKFAVLQEEQPR